MNSRSKKAIFIALCSLLAWPRSSIAEEPAPGVDLLNQRYVSDESIERYVSESRREQLIDWHHKLVDRYNNLLNKIAFSIGLKPQEPLTMKLPSIMIALTNAKGYVVEKYINVFSECQSRLSRSLLLNTLKKKNLDRRTMDSVADDLNEVETWLERAEVAYFKKKLSDDSAVVIAQKEACGAGPQSTSPPISNESIKALNGDVIMRCLNAQKIALNGMILTYDGLNQAHPQDKTRLVKANTIPQSKARTPLPATPQTASSPSPNEQPVRKSSEEALESSPKNTYDKTPTTDNGAPLDKKLLLKTTSRSQSVAEDRIGKFKSDKRSRLGTQTKSTKLKIENKPSRETKAALESYKKSRQETLKIREEQNKEAMQRAFPPSDPLPTPAPEEPAAAKSKSVPNTRLTPDDERLLAMAKPRSRKELLTASEGVLKDVLEEKQSRVDYGAFFVESEIVDGRFKHKEKAFKLTLKRYLHSKRKYEKLAQESNALPYKERVLKLAEEMNKDLLWNYTKKNARVVDLMLGKGGNCEAQSKLIMSVLHEIGLAAGDQDFVFGVQTFDDHVQPVIYDKKNGVVTNLVSNKAITGVIAPIYKPEIFFHGYSNTHGKSVVENEKELTLVSANAALVKEVLVQQQKSSNSQNGTPEATNTNIKTPWPTTGVKFGTGSVPDRATIKFEKNASIPADPIDRLTVQSSFVTTDDDGIGGSDDSSALLVKAKSDLAQALNDKDFRDLMDIVSNPATLKKKGVLDARKIGRMREALTRVTRTLSQRPGSSARKFSFDEGKALFHSQKEYLTRATVVIDRFFRSFKPSHAMPIPAATLLESLTPEELSQFNIIFRIDEIGGLLAIDDATRTYSPADYQVDFERSEAKRPNLDYYTNSSEPLFAERQDARFVTVPLNIAVSFADARATTFEATFAKTKKLEKRGSAGSSASSTEGKASTSDPDPSATEPGPSRRNRAEESARKKIPGTKNATKNQNLVQAYGRSDSGTTHRPETEENAASTKLSAEAFAGYVMAASKSGNFIGNTFKLGGTETYFQDLTLKNAIRLRWSPLLSEELRLNDTEESIELMRWFVEEGAGDIESARADGGLFFPRVKHPTQERGTISHDLARLYAHYYQKLTSIGMELTLQPIGGRIKTYQRLIEEHDQ